MVGIVIVGHSSKMCDNLIEFLSVFKTGDFELLNGSDPNIEFGTSISYLKEIVKKANKGKGVLILLDLGSSIDHSLNIKEQLKDEIKVEIADAPLVEGAISAVAGNDENLSVEELRKIAEDSKSFRKVK